MISRLARLRAKKGFTIIELVVVIAIIGVLTSVVVATLSYDNKPTVGKSLAKDAYYVVQDAVASAEIANPNALKGVSDTSYVGFFAEVDDAGSVLTSGMMNITAGTPGTAPTLSSINAFATKYDLKHDRTDADDLKCLQSKVKDEFSNYLSGKDNMAGTVIVVVDNKYRAIAAYWTDSSIIGISSGPKLNDDCILESGYYCCAYPSGYSYPGKYMCGV